MKPTVSPKQDLTRTDHSAKSLLKVIQKRIEGFSPSPYLDGLVLLSHISGLSKAQILADPPLELPPTGLEILEEQLSQLQAGIPLPYLVGRWEFYQLPFILTPEVLIPRPESEGLVERALAWLAASPERCSCLEVGTGSGCIAISLAKNQPGLRVTATDISPQALAVARENASLHQVEARIDFREANLLQGLEGKYDLLVANLPYIPTGKLVGLQVSRAEPRLALDGGPDGLTLIRALLRDAPARLKPGGRITLELDEDCGQAALALAGQFFPTSEIKLEQDLHGLDRYLLIQT